MTLLDGVDPEFFKLLARSEELLLTVKLKRETEPVDWNEVHRIHNEIKQLGDRMHALLPPRGGLLVALHNNSEGYSVKDEVPISEETSLRQPDDPHAFFLCTDARDFAVLKSSPYNVVLQHAPKDDDGSLSRLAAARGVRYVNLEVALGSADRQREMLRWMEWNLA